MSIHSAAWTATAIVTGIIAVYGLWAVALLVRAL